MQEFYIKIMSILGCTIEQLLLFFLILWWMASETILTDGDTPILNVQMVGDLYSMSW